MNTVVIRDDRDTRHPWSWVGSVQQRQEVAEQPIVFPRAEAIEQLAGGEMQRPSHVVLLMLPWCHDLSLRALRHPGRPDFGQEVDIECLRKDHHLTRLQVFVMKPNEGEALDPVWVVIFGHELRA